MITTAPNIPVTEDELLKRSIGDRFRLKIIKIETGEAYAPQIKKAGWFTRWKPLMPERMRPEIVDVKIAWLEVFSYTKEDALKIIEVYKREQKQKEVIKIIYCYL